MRTVTLCTPEGTPIKQCPIVPAHQDGGQLHLAFSAFVFRNNRTELLIQRRQDDKPTFGGLWANTCCSHPQEGETIEAAGERRLMEELGFTTKLETGPSFVYQADDPKSSFSEHEYDTVLVGDCPDDAAISLDPEEVAEVSWISIADLQMQFNENPEIFAPWFPLACDALSLFDGE